MEFVSRGIEIKKTGKTISGPKGIIGFPGLELNEAADPTNGDY